MPVTWTAEKYQKLLSAVIAAHPEFKFNYREIAIYFGESTTYDAIEGCFRPLRVVIPRRSVRQRIFPFVANND